MSEQWISQSENILKTIEKFTSKKDRDRLEIINTMIFTLNSLDRSIRGWRGWIQNLTFMSRFTTKELQAIEEGLLKSVRTFIENDIDVTKKHKNKIPRIRFKVRRRQRSEEVRRGMIA